MNVENLLEQLWTRGWVHLSSKEKLLATKFIGKGRVISQSDIVTKNDSNQFIHGNGYIEFHTDDPRADFIIWRCDEQAEKGGENLLKNVDVAYQKLALEIKNNLHNVKFLVNLPGAPYIASLVEHLQTRNHYYYAPWKSGPDRSPEQTEALFMLTIALGQLEPEKVLLKPEEHLILNNRFYVHGRAPFQGTRRALHRTLLQWR